MSGKDENISVDALLELLQRKRIPSLCVELRSEIMPLNRIFADYQQAVPGALTCLQPVKEALNIPEASKLSELLEILSGQGKIERVLGYYLPEDFNGIPEYDTSAIHKRLNELARKG